MYGQLLAAALAAMEGSQGTEGDLVRELAHDRVRLAPRWTVAGAGPTVDAAASLVAQIEYDVTLLRLCQLHGIASEPGRFARPGHERARLELALRRAGVPVGA